MGDAWTATKGYWVSCEGISFYAIEVDCAPLSSSADRFTWRSSFNELRQTIDVLREAESSINIRGMFECFYIVKAFTTRSVIAI